MQRYHDPSNDPLPTRSPSRDKERERLAQLTQAFLDAGGKIEQVGHRMKDRYAFIVRTRKSPPEAEPMAPLQAELGSPDAAPEMSARQLSARLMAQAALGASPGAAAHILGISEQRALQLAREYRITFKRQH